MLSGEIIAGAGRSSLLATTGLVKAIHAFPQPVPAQAGQCHDLRRAAILPVPRQSLAPSHWLKFPPSQLLAKAPTVQ